MPNNPEDQDTYEQLMTIEDKEIKYWLSVNEEPPFINELGIDWNLVVEDYLKRQEILRDSLISIEVVEYNDIIDKLTEDDVQNISETGQLPKDILEFLTFDGLSKNFISKQHNVVIGNIYDIIDKDFTVIEVDDMLI
jgi:hypothetical protein